MVLVLVSTVLATGLALLVLPFINSLLGQELQITHSMWLTLPLAILGMAVITGLLAGLYPAVVLSGFRPIQVLKGGSFERGKGGNMRKILVVGQFAVSAGLIIATLVVFRQLKFMQDKSLGLNKDHIVTMNFYTPLAAKYESFRNELLAALQMAQNGVPPRNMKSSWAGALGQPQFMPSSYLKHAADGDGDGRADIWGSQADTLASIASYLRHHGWQTGRDWGFEVVVPQSVACTLEGPDQGRTIAQWEAMGIRRVNGKPFPAHELKGEGYLMMPAGRLGPAFIVTPNFYVLKDYNESDLYALFVGHVGDRIEWNVGDFTQGWGKIDKLWRSDIAAMQRVLERQGHDVGGADGLPGFKTRRSIGAWQAKNGRQPTCFPDAELIRAIR